MPNNMELCQEQSLQGSEFAQSVVVWSAFEYMHADVKSRQYFLDKENISRKRARINICSASQNL